MNMNSPGRDFGLGGGSGPHSGQLVPMEDSVDMDDGMLPHVRELTLCMTADLVHINNKYGHFESIPPVDFPHQLYPAPLSITSGNTNGDLDDDDEDEVMDSLEANKGLDEHYGGSPILAYDPAFTWHAERAATIGQRLPILPLVSSSVSMRFSVRILMMNVQPGLAEPFFGTLCLFHVERKEKVSEDFHFQFLPPGWEGVYEGQVLESTPPDRRAIFSVESQSPALCLLVQLEKTVSEESSGGVKPSVYSRKDPPHLVDKEAERLRQWARMMPYREAFAWVTIPLFDSSVTGGIGGFGAASDLATSGMGTPGSTSGVGVDGMGVKGGTTYELGGPPVQIEIPHLHRAKECYTDDQLLEPWRKAQKQVRVTMRFEVERLPGGPLATAGPGTGPGTGGANSMAGTPMASRSITAPPGSGPNSRGRTDSFNLPPGQSMDDGFVPRSGSSGGPLASEDGDGGEKGGLGTPRTQPSPDGRQVQQQQQEQQGTKSQRQKRRSISRALSHESLGSALDDIVMAQRSLTMSKLRVDGIQAIDFTDMQRPEPFTKMHNLCFVYPQSLSTTKKYNLVIRIELKADDSVQKPVLDAVCPRQPGGPLQRSAYSQIIVGQRPALFHDEFKLQLPQDITPQHHILFTFCHVEMASRTTTGPDPYRPAPIGYAVLPLTMAIQSYKGEINLPVFKELLPRYTQESVKAKLAYWETGWNAFKVRTRVFSTLYPLSDKVRAFFREYDRQVLETALPSAELLDSINSLKSVEPTILIQFLYPILNMLLCMIGNGVETLQVAAFRAMVNIISRVQAETATSPGAGSQDRERNRYLVHFVDFIFDDLGRHQAPVYPGLSNVWRSLARSKAKGYRVGPVYSEALSMSWFVLELIVKSMDLELAQVPQGDEIARLRLEDEVFQCIWQLFECLLSEIQERADTDYALARRISNSVSFFCYDLISVVDPPQVFELVGMFLTKFAGVCSPVLHTFKLLFLRIVCDHDFYIETPGRVPIEKNYLTTVLLKELFVSLDHEDSQQRAVAARMLCFLVTKHEYDERYQAPELKLYIAQLYFPIINMILDEVAVFNNLDVLHRRFILVCMLTIVRNLDDETLLKSWKQSEQRTRLFFQLLQEAVVLFQYKGEYHKQKKGKAAAPGFLPPADLDTGELPTAPCFSDRLSPTANDLLEDMARKDPKTVLTLQLDGAMKRLLQQQQQQQQQQQLLAQQQQLSQSGQLVPQSGNLTQPALGTPGGVGSAGGGAKVPTMREAVSKLRLSTRDAIVMLRESLPPSAQKKMMLWEANVAAWTGLEVLEVLEKFSEMAEERIVAADYATMDSLTGPVSALLAVQQPVALWALVVPALAQMLRVHGSAMLGPGKERVVKDMLGSFMRNLVVRPEFVRRRALVGLLLLLRNTMRYHSNSNRLKVMLTMSLSEVLSQMRLLEKTPEGETVESMEVDRLRYSLEEMASEESWMALLADCGLPLECLEVMEDGENEEEFEDEEDEEFEDEDEEMDGRRLRRRRRRTGNEEDGWTWEEVRELQETLLTVIDAASQHAQLLEGLKSSGDKYAIVESFYILAQAYGHVPDLYIMWMLHLCEAHQEMQQWAEAAQCCVSVAGIVIRALQGLGYNIWGKEHLDVLWRVCPLARHQWRAKAFMEGFGASSLTVDSAVKYLQMASTFFSKAELFHFCAELLSLMLPAFKARRDYQQLSKCHTSLTNVYESILVQEASPIPFRDAAYYRVGFYGERFGYINGREFIYREPRGVRLGDIIEKLRKLYDARSKGEEPLHIIQDSKAVDPANLKPGMVHMQITAVEPVVGEGEDRWLGRPLEPSAAGAPIFGCFMFDTPFTVNGKMQGKMEEQWKRRTLLYTQSTLPSLISRQPVVRSEVREYTPVECAVEIIDSRAHALEVEMAAQLGGRDAGATAHLQLPRLQSLQRLLQGSVALQVNSGVLGVCMAFYQASNDGVIRPKEGGTTQLSLQDLEDLTATIVHFVVVCKKATVVHGKAVKEEDRDIHEQLVRSFEELVVEISNFIPGIRKRTASV